MEAKLNMDLTSVESVKLKGMGVNVSSVFDFVPVWLEILEVLSTELQALGKLSQWSQTFHFFIDEVGQDVRSFLSISNLRASEADDFLLTDHKQVTWDLSKLTVIKIEDGSIWGG